VEFVFCFLPTPARQVNKPKIYVKIIGTFGRLATLWFVTAIGGFVQRAHLGGGRGVFCCCVWVFEK
jgi:hypothetical protein